MIFFFPSKTYLQNLADSPEERPDVEKKINEISRRNKIVKGMKNPKWYDKGIWVLKQMGQGKNYRVIFQEIFDHHLGEEYQLIILRDFVSQKKYEPYWRARIEPIIDRGNYLDEYPLEEQERKKAIEALSYEINKPPTPKELAPENLTKWIWDFGVNQHFSIYESPNWSSRSHLVEEYISDLFTLIKKVLLEENNVDKKQIGIVHRSLWEATQDPISIIYEKTNIIEEQGKDLVEIVFLHGWWPHDCSHEEIEKERLDAINYPNFTSIIEKEYTREIVSQGAYRGYPELIFKQNSREQWKRIQTNSNKSNLALAHEQETLLQRFLFPKFINGQAGSGKSEMLMYLFAELCFRKECDDVEGNILFLTENEELLERAFLDTIEKLSFNSQYISYKIDNSKIKEYFNTYRGFLVENLIEEDLKEKYKESKYINFSTFKQKYQDSGLSHSIKSRYPAEIAWFIIMTYIRGYDSEKEEITPDEFREIIRRKERSFVDITTYSEVYEKIWKGFYKKLLEQNDSWDRLTLVRHVLNEYREISTDKKYTVIVCDEAQDFTKLELQLLIKLSKYGDYDLSQLNCVPIVFAGDPFQTVNPTGFDLKQIKNLFWHEIKENLNVKFDIEILLSNLKNNYRSTPEIVNLANLTQYIRYKFLHLTDLNEPQKPRKNPSRRVPSIFRLEETENDNLKEKLGYAVFIGPCNQGEESDYKNADNWLTENLVLKSAALAKGSEYPVVCIYKFGEEFVKEFGEDSMEKILSDETFYGNLSQGDKFRINFFFNKLYVAITRAQDELFILDTSRGLKLFWRFFRDHIYLRNIPEEEWQTIKASECFSDGKYNSVDKVDFKVGLQSATNDEESGLLYQDKDKMRDAARMYQLLGADYGDNVEFCLAKALEFESSYKEAGDKFRSCNLRRSDFDRTESASNCYWIGGYWRELLSLHGSNIEKEKYKVRNAVAKLMIEQNFDIQTIIVYSEKIPAAIREDSSCAGKIDWEQKFYDKLIDYIKSNKKDFTGKISKIAHSLDRFPKKPDNLNELIADLYFEDKNHKLAMEKWQELDKLDHQKYYKAAAEEYLKTNPSKAIFYLNKLKDEDRIFELFRNRKDQLDTDAFEIIIDLLWNKATQKSLSDIIDIYHDHNLRLNSLFDRIVKESKEPKETKMILVLDALSNKYKLLPLDKIQDWPIRDFVSAIGIILSNPKVSALSRTIRRDDQNSIHKEEGKLRKIIQSNEWIYDFFQAIIQIISRSPLSKDESSDVLAITTFNLFIYGDSKKISKLNPIEVAAFLEKVLKRFADKQRIYTEIDDFLLRDKEIRMAQKIVIERRFWKVRYDINAREEKSDEEIKVELKKTKKYFNDIEFLLEPPSTVFLRDMPDCPSFDDLYTEVIELEKKDPGRFGAIEAPPKGIENQSDMHELKGMIKQLNEQMTSLLEQNKQLNSQISELRKENRSLSKRNEELQEKLLKLL